MACQNQSKTVILILFHFYPALNKVREILKKTQRYTIRSPRLSAVLPSPTRVAFRNPKTLTDHLVRSKLKIRDSNDEENGIYKCGNINSDICNVSYLGNEFQSAVTEKRYHTNFKFDCNNINLIYLLTCKRCRKQYIGFTVTKFHMRFNQYKSNIKLYGERKRGFKQEKLIEHFFCSNHNGNQKDIFVETNGQCDLNDQEGREDFWIHHLDTMFPKGMNQRKLLRYNKLYYPGFVFMEILVT